MDDNFTEVYDKTSGAKQRVPAEWLDHPVLGRNIAKTPTQRALDGEIGAPPTAASTVAEIRQFAADAEIDVTGLTVKPELLAAVNAAVGTGDQVVNALGEQDAIGTPTTPAPDGTEPPDNSPATGDKE